MGVKTRAFGALTLRWVLELTYNERSLVDRVFTGDSMVTRVVLAGLVACAGFLAFEPAQAADVKPSEFVVCKSAKSVRTLSVTPEDSKTGAKACKVTYTKGGVPETVGQHTNKASCHSILDQVKVSLEDSKWNCRNVSARTTTSSEVSSQ